MAMVHLGNRNKLAPEQFALYWTNFRIWLAKTKLQIGRSALNALPTPLDMKASEFPQDAMCGMKLRHSNVDVSLAIGSPSSRYKHRSHARRNIQALDPA